MSDRARFMQSRQKPSDLGRVGTSSSPAVSRLQVLADQLNLHLLISSPHTPTSVVAVMPYPPQVNKPSYAEPLLSYDYKMFID